MARKRGRLDFNNEAPGIGKRHRAEKTGWKKERLLAIKLLLEGELDIAAVARLVGRHRNRAGKVSPGTRKILDLGQVENIAEVILNGVNLGILWKPPFAVDITTAAKPGTNRLEVRVTNRWINRLIGDEQETSDVEWCPGEHGLTLKEWPEWFTTGKPRPSSGRIGFTTFKLYEKDSPLVKSGLLGPVTIQSTEFVK